MPESSGHLSCTSTATLLAEVIALHVSRVSADAVAGSRILPASVVLVAAVCPFEVALPGSLFGLTFTTLELAIAVSILIAAIAWTRGAGSFVWRTPITWPLLAVLAAALLSTLAAQEFRGEALRVSVRFAVAIALFLVVVNVASLRVAGQIVAALLASGAVVGLVAILELAQLPSVLNALKVFRPGFHVVGGQLRATSTLIYPTVTSMFLEIVFALGLVWLTRSRVAFVALSLVAAGVIATFTRAGLITMAVSIVVFGATLYSRQRRWSSAHSRLAVLSAALVAMVLVSRSPQMLVARISAEGSQEWYGASYSVPTRLTLQPDSFNDVAVTLKNDGRLTWQSSQTPPFALSYHWLTSDTEDVVLFDGLRTPFPQPVGPGESIALRARVRAPNYPGRYVLVWDVVQEHRTWLSLEGVFPGRSLAVVTGTPSGPPPPTRGRMPSTVMRMPRSVLWTTGWQIARDHPVVGIGPDNFRHTYGRYLGLSAWDTRVHANNSYIEVMAGMGLAGLAALLWLVVAVLRRVPALLAADDARLPLVAAAASACLAIAAHALVDSFLTFTPTYAVFAIAVGLLFSTRRAERAACA